MSATRFDPYEPDLLPAVVRGFLESQRNSTRELSVDTVFTADARVVDENTEYLGSAAIREWLTTSASQYTYTLDYIGQARPADDTWLVTGHLEGNFPGGRLISGTGSASMETRSASSSSSHLPPDRRTLPCPRSDSNRHWTGFESVASANWATGANAASRWSESLTDDR